MRCMVMPVWQILTKFEGLYSSIVASNLLYYSYAFGLGTNHLFSLLTKFIQALDIINLPTLK